MDVDRSLRSRNVNYINRPNNQRNHFVQGPQRFHVEELRNLEQDDNEDEDQDRSFRLK